jgi:hypothetical protein
MGGFGTMSYAARHPDAFSAAASFSGAVDSINAAIQAVTPQDTYGPFETQEIRWRGKNPVDLAANLRGLRLTLRTGNGSAGGPFGGGDGIAFVVHKASVALHDRLGDLGIPHVWDDYGPGGHLWPYWRRDLRRTLPWLMKGFAHPRRPPSPFSYRTIDPRYEIYGWRVRIARPALEWSELRTADRHGFTIVGSGRALVIPPTRYPPGARLRVVYRSSRYGVVRGTERAGRTGRVAFAVPLGPGNRDHQYAPGARTAQNSAAVRVTPLP